MSHNAVGCGKQTKLGVRFALEEVGEGNLEEKTVRESQGLQL